MASRKKYEIGLYQRTTAIGSTPFERLSTMYCGAIRLCKQGLSSAKTGDTDNARAKASQLKAVVRRLDVCLDFSIAPDLCKNLSQLYRHIQARLELDNVGEQPEVFAETLKLLDTLWDGFQTAHARSKH
jgi:flagellin-specific chaperone FliS